MYRQEVVEVVKAMQNINLNFNIQNQKLDSCQAAIKSIQEEQENNKENNMDTNMNLYREQIRYVQSRAHEIFSNKDNEARTLFKLENDEAPKTFKEMQERIASGKYILDEKREAYELEAGYYLEPLRFITWRDPAVPADQVGYDAFKTKLRTAYQTLEDEVNLGDPEGLLQSLKPFEALPVE